MAKREDNILQEDILDLAKEILDTQPAPEAEKELPTTAATKTSGDDVLKKNTLIESIIKKRLDYKERNGIMPPNVPSKYKLKKMSLEKLTTLDSSLESELTGLPVETGNPVNEAVEDMYTNPLADLNKEAVVVDVVKTTRLANFCYTVQKQIYGGAESVFAENEKVPLEGLTDVLEKNKPDLIAAYIDLLGEYSDNETVNMLTSPGVVALLLNVEVIGQTIAINKIKKTQ